MDGWKVWLYEPLLLALELFSVVPFPFLVLPWEAPFSGLSFLLQCMGRMAGMAVEMMGSVTVLTEGDGRQQEAKAGDREVQRVSRGWRQRSSRVGGGGPWPL